MPPPQRGPRPQPATDIDRFLQEVDRLRRKAADETKKPPLSKQDARYDEVMEVLPAEPPPPPVARPRRPRRFDDVEVVTTPTVAPAPRPAPPPPPPSAPFPVTQPQPASTVPTTAPIATVSRPAAPRAAGQRRQASPAAAQLLALLRGGNVRSAILLREVLDGPLSRRRRR